MREFFIFAVGIASCAAQAQVTAVPFFPTTPTHISNYDALPPGSKPAIPVFSGAGTAARMGTSGLLLIGGFGSPKSPPNMMFGRGVNVQITVKPAFPFFGGYFKQAPAGLKVTKVTFKFFNIANMPIGVVTRPLTTTWTWIGFRTKPNWAKVQVIGNGNLPGYVAFDDTRVR